MLALASLALLLAAQEPVSSRPDTLDPRAAEIAARAIERASRAEAAREARRIAVTPEHLATAFEDARARELLARARVARLRQDSALTSYDATVETRFTLGAAMTAIGRERIVVRHEHASRVRWQHDAGLHVMPIAGRTVVPAVLGDRVMSTPATVPPIPYFPGQETLMASMGTGRVKEEVDVDDMIHPVARGSEAYYRYATGDSIAIRLPDGYEVRLIELRFRPRRPQWRLAVGSLWLDAASAQIVRAAFRLSVPLNVWEVIQEEGEDEEIPAAVRPMLRSATANVTAVLAEHGLYEGRFWLPRVVSMEGEGKIMGVRASARYVHTFDYASVNSRLEGMPPPAVTAQRRDTLLADSLGVTGPSRDSLFTAQRRARRQARREAARTRCQDGEATYRQVHTHAGIHTVSDTPCDTLSLVTHPILPPSIFEPGEELFTEVDRESMMRALGIDAQARWEPQRPVVRYGYSDGLLRFNRIEGLSAGVAAEQRLGHGLTADARVQLGVADLQPNAELGLSRTDLRREFRLGAYRRLVSVDDWGEAFGLGSSLSAFLFARDDFLYYRTWGVELTGQETLHAQARWRVFAERHHPARVETQRSLPNLLSGREFADNIEAEHRTSIGAEARVKRSLGWDPRGLRAFVDVRLEGAAGDALYGRFAGDATVSRGLGGAMTGALTLSAGSSIGSLPVQRHWHLGGSHTVRGQEPGTTSGNAYWMVRAELGGRHVGARPVVFYDLGWAGDRSRWGRSGVPVSGGGIGLSLLDGLARVDLAAGMRPSRGLQLRLYLDSRF